MIRILNQYASPKSILLMILEGLLIAASVMLSIRLRFWSHPSISWHYITLPVFVWQTTVIVVIFQICFYYNNLYDLSAKDRRPEQFIRLAQALGAACMLLGLVYLAIPPLLIGRGVLTIILVLVAALTTLNRIAIDRAWPVASPTQNVLILGAGEPALHVARELARREDLNLRLVGFLQAAAVTGTQQRSVLGCPILGCAADVETVCTKLQISRIIVALAESRGVLPTRALAKLKVHGVWVEDAQSAMASLTGRVWLENAQPSWFVFSDGFSRSRLTVVLKRASDLCAGFVGLITTAPLMLLIAIAVRLDSKGPAIYRQTRVGFRGECFELLKFRSMRMDAEVANGAQWAEKDDPRITRVGRFLRNFRLDELPQFLNVIHGQMSFVGPRPERPVFVEKLREEIPYYDERHSVRPGLTGWAQVQYSYGASVKDAIRKLEYDLFYLKHMSFLFDCVIIAQTVRIVLFGKGAR